MKPGSIKVAQHEGVFVIKMEGDVRLTLCLSFDSFIESMFSQSDFKSVVFDLTDAEAIDSTTLGLMAKISINGKAKQFDDPIVISRNPSITRLLVTMGFEDIFQIVRDADIALGGELPLEIEQEDADENAVRDKVLEAHRTLMNLNENNKITFKELVQSLEEQQ
ncbi:STAS domain-containing protein [Saccharophagus degradans]|uniref:STAS domain-containing protein n=1 Tax=Saccharophagus degradans TaxID=86304 RepID=A0AAW7X8S1_9GAMM|nr:STAS domain-containing protein [Saccharophagus degradans]MBU2984417.1 STAS domain-containing protein [Saccharophagus degradans]MDO6422817.1 STAS domain-containing protein [Saccharophagus degradans]MDO6609238.1 STAS domain-containing protein [Saccharophagus degradans]WGO97451.1 STAS domain-containing protein [Saccharophagus degradans]